MVKPFGQSFLSKTLKYFDFFILWDYDYDDLGWGGAYPLLQWFAERRFWYGGYGFP